MSFKKKEFWTIQLNEDQMSCVSQCLDKIINSDENLFVISGSAGVGKTYLIHSLETSLSKFYNLAVCAFTGVAAFNASDKGRTLHSLIYDVTYDNKGNFYFVEKDKSRFEQQVLLVDEASMIPDDILEYLFDLNIKIIFFGDHKQLPPVKKSNFNILDDTDYTLTQVVRTKTDDPIVHLSLDAHAHNRISEKFNRFNNINIMQDYPVGKLLKDKNYDCIITATNKQRQKLNKMVRSINGHESEIPEKGEKIICLKNSVDNGGKTIFNGQRFEVLDRNDISPDESLYKLMNADNSVKMDNSVYWVKVKNKHFVNDVNSALQQLNKNESDDHVFTFAYAITCHKAQGKEYNNVLFIDQDVSYFLPQNRFRYTAITRAKETIDIIKK